MILPQEIEPPSPAQVAAVGTGFCAVGLWLARGTGRMVGGGWTRSAPAPGSPLTLLETLWLAASFFLLNMLLVAVAVGRLPESAPEEPVELGALTGLGILALSLALISLLGLGAAARRRGGLLAVGLRRGQNGRAVWSGFVSWLRLTPLLLGLALLWPLLHSAPEQAQTWEEQLGRVLGGVQTLPAVVLVALVIPVFEECVFRGLLQPVLVQRLGPVGGIATTAALFTALHPASHYLPILALAILLGWLAHRTGRLAAPVTVHVLHNGTMMALLLVATT